MNLGVVSYYFRNKMIFAERCSLRVNLFSSISPRLILDCRIIGYWTNLACSPNVAEKSAFHKPTR